MTKRMLVDATHPEETRVAIVDENRLEDFDFESANKKQLKGNIYLAKVIRIEPSLQAAFVEYGGNRHGFLPFSEIHPDYFRIPVGDRPHDEDVAENEPEDEADISAEAYAEQVQAYQNEAEESEEALPQEAIAETTQPEGEIVAPVPLKSASEAAEPFAPSENALPLPAEHPSGLGAAVESDLGLITDFGNAAADAAFTPPPVETVGGQEAEEEEVIRRAPRPRPMRYRIQEVIKRRQIMLIQVVKEERGNKGAALTTFLSLAGRYCVLMPNTDRGGGVSRKITSHQDRRRMKEVLDQLETPEGMAVILRTAGMEQEPAEIQRDLEHLLRLWNTIREQTLVSTAPTLIYEEANLIKRSIRDLFSANVGEILVAGKKGYDLAHEFIRSIMPEGHEKVRLYEESIPLFFRYNVEKQIDQLYNPIVQLRSGGYIVINPTEALVSIDVNSGRATRERHIEGTALKTNLEAADEIARQLRLRDLAGLIVIDFIDMEDGRNNAAVERRMKEAMKSDRARLQIGRLSAFGLMELSRQRLHPSLTEINFERCPHCAGTGMIRSVDSAAISVLRVIEEEAIRQSGGEMVLHVPTKVALYILNQKRAALIDIERRYNLQILLHSDDTLVAPECKLERSRAGANESRVRVPAVDSDQVLAEAANDESGSALAPQGEGERQERRGRGRYGRGRRERSPRPHSAPPAEAPAFAEPDGNVISPENIVPDNIGNVASSEFPAEESTFEGQAEVHRQGNRRRGRRGGRGRHGDRDNRRNNNHDNGRRSFTPSEQPQSAYAPAPVSMPISIHDLDTTPRDNREQSPAAPGAAPVAAPSARSEPQAGAMVSRVVVSSAPPPSPYEVTGLESDKPKGGWWRKLTGQ